MNILFEKLNKKS